MNKRFQEKLLSYWPFLPTWKAPKIMSGRMDRPLPWLLWIIQAANVTYFHPVSPSLFLHFILIFVAFCVFISLWSVW